MFPSINCLIEENQTIEGIFLAKFLTIRDLWSGAEQNRFGGPHFGHSCIKTIRIFLV